MLKVHSRCSVYFGYKQQVFVEKVKQDYNKTMSLRPSKSGATVTFNFPIYTSKGFLFTLHVK